MIWQFKKKGQVFTDIHKHCGDVTDAVIKYSMKKLTVDNVTVIFIAFNNFEKKMNDINFEYEYNKETTQCKFIGDEKDLKDSHTD